MSNAKFNYNKQETREEEMKNFKILESASVNFPELMRSNSPDEFLINKINSLNRRDTNEFTKQFDRNFNEGNDKDEFILKDNDFTLNNLKFNAAMGNAAGMGSLNAGLITQISQRERMESVINMIEFFTNSEEFINPKINEINIVYLKMTNLLCEVNLITNVGNTFSELKNRALELQTLLLTNMIRLTQFRISQC